eukprot:COSAG06_NODE_26638_length_610_cov_1.103718_1_plen_22_part_10
MGVFQQIADNIFVTNDNTTGVP